MVEHAAGLTRRSSPILGRHLGRAAAIRYMRDVRDAAKKVATEPTRARPRQGPWRLMRARSHYLICHCEENADRFAIVRVLHGAMHIERHLPPDARA